MESGWHADPTGRHNERYFSGGVWTGNVRTDGVRAFDGMDGDPSNAVLRSDAASAGMNGETRFVRPPMPSPTPAPFAPVATPPPTVFTAAPGPGPATPPTVPVVSATPPSGAYGGYGPQASSIPLPAPHSAGPSPSFGVAPTPWPAGATPPTPWTATPGWTRRGLPGFLMVALVIASFPAMLVLGLGISVVLASNEISDTTYGWEYGDLNDSTGAAAELGVIVALVGGAALLFVVMAGTGNNAGRIITVIWMSLLVLYLLSQMDQVPDGGFGYVLLIMTPPILAIIGFFTPLSNAVYQKT